MPDRVGLFPCDERVVYAVLYSLTHSGGDDLHAIYEREADAEAYVARQHTRSDAAGVTRTGHYEVREMRLR